MSFDKCFCKSNDVKVLPIPNGPHIAYIFLLLSFIKLQIFVRRLYLIPL